MIGAPYHFHLGGPTDVLTQYYGDADAQAKAKCPHGLLEVNPAPELLPIFFLISEKELPYIAITGNEFMTLLNEKTGSSYDIKIMKVIATSAPIGPWKPVKAKSGEKI